MTSLRFALAWVIPLVMCTAHAQDCGAPSDGFHRPGADQSILAAVVWDDGSGPALYVAGDLRSMGPIVTGSIARFDGSTWSAVGGPVGSVQALAVYGGMLYAGGQFLTAGSAPAANVARFDGTSWSALPGGGASHPVYALEVFQGQLYLGGSFSVAGGVTARSIARFDGTRWSNPTGGPHNGWVLALKAFDDGSGSKLYVGGSFEFLGSVSGPLANGIAMYDGRTWSALDGGMVMYDGSITEVRCLEAFDSGSGPRLHAGGMFDRAGGASIKGIAQWTGNDWVQMSDGISGSVKALRAHDDGSGPCLYATGTFKGAGFTPARGIARWNGATWSALGAGITGVGKVLTSFQGALVVGGTFYAAGGQSASHLARFASGTWSPFFSGHGMPTSVLSLATYDAGAGAELYAGIASNGMLYGAEHFFRWNGNGWAGLGLRNGEVSSAVAFDNGSGPKLYVAGGFSAIGGVPAVGFAAWDGTRWSAPSALSSITIRKLRVLDAGTGPALYAANVRLSMKEHGVPDGSYVARWSGSAWQPLGEPLYGIIDDIRDVAVYDGGTGPRIYAAGKGAVAAFDPLSSAWTSVGELPLGVTLKVHDDGSGSKLYVGGSFQNVGGAPATGVARWNGSTWSAVGLLIEGNQPRALVQDWAVHDAGNGPRLIAAGYFEHARQRGLAAWDGTTWTPVADLHSPASFPNAVASFDDGLGNGPDLWVAGYISELGGQVVGNIGRIEACGALGSALCFGDGSGTPCPRGNHSALGANSGCLNSLGVGGKLVAQGDARITNDTFVLSGTSMPNESVLYFASRDSITGGAGTVFGDGLRSAATNPVRLGTTTNVGGGSTLPNATQPTPLSQLDRIAPGTQRVYQAWYRNAASFCTNAAFNATNAWRVNWSL
jgi:trimeric autotransporter adhesin